VRNCLNSVRESLSLPRAFPPPSPKHCPWGQKGQKHGFKVSHSHEQCLVKRVQEAHCVSGARRPLAESDFWRRKSLPHAPPTVSQSVQSSPPRRFEVFAPSLSVDSVLLRLRQSQRANIASSVFANNNDLTTVRCSASGRSSVLEKIKGFSQFSMSHRESLRSIAAPIPSLLSLRWWAKQCGVTQSNCFLVVNSVFCRLSS